MTNAGTTVYSDSFRHTLDDKNRVTIPSAWRSLHTEGDQFLATPQPDGSIAILPPDAIERIRAKSALIPLSNTKGRQAIARFFANSHAFSFDKQGRTALTDAHRQHAKITKDLILVGAGDSFVIYSPETWGLVNQPQDDTATLAELGI